LLHLRYHGRVHHGVEIFLGVDIVVIVHVNRLPAAS
jgi:hypothetical protein